MFPRLSFINRRRCRRCGKLYRKGLGLTGKQAISKFAREVLFSRRCDRRQNRIFLLRLIISHHRGSQGKRRSIVATARNLLFACARRNFGLRAQKCSGTLRLGIGKDTHDNEQTIVLNSLKPLNGKTYTRPLGVDLRQIRIVRLLRPSGQNAGKGKARHDRKK